MLKAKFNLLLARIGTPRLFKVEFLKYSTVPASKHNQEANIEKEAYDGLSKVLSRNRIKQAQRAPFAKNFFAGKFDINLLTYPQLQKDDVDHLEKVTEILQRIANQDDAKNLKETLQQLRDKRCLGLQCSVDVGGRELNPTEQCRFNEVLLDNKFKYNLLNNEICILTLMKYGTVEQKDRYLTKLLDGSISATLCLGDNHSGNAENLVRTVAHRLKDRKSYMIKGRKNYVIGGTSADLFIVFTQMGDSVEGSVHEGDLTLFLIDSTLPGVKVEKIDCKNQNLDGMANIIFDTVLTTDSILGIERNGGQILSGILPDYHMSFSVLNLSILKKLSKFLSQDILRKSPNDEDIHKIEAITARLGEVIKLTYIVESMIYFTSGLMSNYENQDCELETLITRVFSNELVMKATQIGLSMSGVPSIAPDHFCQELNQDALSQFISYENHDMLSISIALMGLQYTGKNMVDTVKKLRNPLFHSSFILKKLWLDRKQHNDNPRLDLGLKNYLHPSCQASANLVEYCVLRLKYATENCFARYGIEVLNQHCNLRRLAITVVQIYAMTACLSRASRSYCIGLQHAELEIFLANLICANGKDIVKKNVDEIICEYDMPDKNWKSLTEQLFNKKKYQMAHPLSRNF